MQELCIKRFYCLLVFCYLILAQSAFASLPIVQFETPYPGTYIFKPNDGKAHPGIVMLHGSEGGSNKIGWSHAIILASGGFSVMTFCWYDCGRAIMTSPQPILENIDVDKTVAAIKWFKESEYVGKHNKLGLYGISRGAEQALLIASYQPKIDVKIDAVAVHAPADILYGGWSNNWIDSRCWKCDVKSKACTDNRDNWSPMCGNIYGDHQSIDDIRAWKWNGVYLPLHQRIEVENYKTPILITCGDKDTIWPSDQTRRIEATLNNAGLHPEVHMFAGEDHVFTIPAEQKRKKILEDYFHRMLDA